MEHISRGDAMKKILQYQIGDKTFRRVIKSFVVCPFNIEYEDCATGGCTHLVLSKCNVCSGDCPLDDALPTDNDVIFGVEVTEPIEIDCSSIWAQRKEPEVTE